MHTPLKKETENLDFQSFIKEYFNWFDIDGHNLKILQDLSLWANRDKRFNDREPGWHIDRGILIWGNPGAGKDELFKILNVYLNYLGSRYRFSHKVVWKFAGAFQLKVEDGGGFGCFNLEGKGNRQYEELCLTDEKSGYPEREVVNNFGNKILIGSELIHVTYDAFKNTGIQSHFSTNAKEDELREIYGARIYSRLKYMCNFMKLVGIDRRLITTPVFMKNSNQPVLPPPPRELSKDIDIENKKAIEDYYAQFLLDNSIPTNAAIVYNIMASYGVSIMEDEAMRVLMEQVADEYVGVAGIARKTERERAEAKRIFVWEESKKRALREYYELLKNKGAKSVFGEREVNVDGMVKGKQSRREP